MDRLRGRRACGADAGRRRALARHVGADHRDGLPLGDRRAHHRGDRGHGPGRDGAAPRIELRARARRHRRLPRPDPEPRGDDRRLHPRPHDPRRGRPHRRSDHARGRPRLPADREQPARPDDLRQGREHLAVLRDPRRHDLRRAARRARCARRGARDRLAPDRAHRGDAHPACRRSPPRGRTLEAPAEQAGDAAAPS